METVHPTWGHDSYDWHICYLITMQLQNILLYWMLNSLLSVDSSKAACSVPNYSASIWSLATYCHLLLVYLALGILIGFVGFAWIHCHLTEHFFTDIQDFMSQITQLFANSDCSHSLCNRLWLPSHWLQKPCQITLTDEHTTTVQKLSNTPILYETLGADHKLR